MSERILQLKEAFHRIAQSLGIEKYDGFGTFSVDLFAGAQDGKPFGLSASQKSKLTIRVWDDEGRVGVATTSNLAAGVSDSEGAQAYEGLRAAFVLAANGARFGDPQAGYAFSPLCLAQQESYTDGQEEMASMAQLAAAAVVCENQILKADARITAVPYNRVGQGQCESFYINSVLAFRHQITHTAFCYFYPLAKEPDCLARQSGQTAVATSFSKLGYLECAQLAVEKTQQHLSYAAVQTGRYTVVFGPEAFLDLFQAFSNIFNGPQIEEHKSLCKKDQIGTLLASPCLDVTDEPWHPKRVDKVYFDQEGTPTAPCPIFREGILQQVIHTSHSARLFDQQPTGHSVLGAKLTAHPHFLSIRASAQQQSPQPTPAMLVYIQRVKALHAGVNALQGSFSLPFDGFLVQGGKQVSIDSATVAGDFLALLQQICYVGATPVVTPQGVCPDVWVQDLSVTGSVV